MFPLECSHLISSWRDWVMDGWRSRWRGVWGKWREEQGEFRNEVLASLIRRIYTCLVGIECWGATSVESSWGMMPSIFMFSQHLHLFVFEVMFYVKPWIFKMTDDSSFHSWRQHVLHLYHRVPVRRPGHLCRCCTSITDGGCMVSSRSPILLLF